MAAPDLTTTILLEEIACGQWHAVCPDGVPRGVVNWAEALTGALWWAEMDGLAVITRDLRGRDHLMMHAREAAR